jgi:predicted transcriptional regulator
VIIEIRDPSLGARLNRQLRKIGAGSLEEVLRHLLETQEDQDRWLVLNRDAINESIQRGLEQLDRGEVIPEDQLDAYLADLKAKASND